MTVAYEDGATAFVTPGYARTHSTGTADVFNQTLKYLERGWYYTP